MANRQSRYPGDIRRFDETARIGDAPAFAVDTGDAWRAAAGVFGQLSNRLGKMADDAAAREGEIAGMNAGASSGAAYLRMQAAQNAASGANSASNGPTIRMNGDIRKIVSDAAMRHGVDPNAMLRIAMIESSGNPNAKNPNSSAGGLFQFIDSTAKAYGLANRYDPAQAADAAARLARDNAGHLRKVLGRDPTAGELYLAHQQGAGGAAKLLRNPGGDAISTVGADAVRLNGGRAGMTNGEFAQLWIRKAGGGTGIAKSAGGDQPAVSVLPTEPLALRRDGTIAGDAYDRAAMNAYAWRMQTGVENAISAAAVDNPDDPNALADRLSEIHGEFMKDGNLADPMLREAFDKRFVELSQSSIMSARAKGQAKMRAEEQAAVVEGLDAQRIGLERQGVALGANPQGDAIMAREVEKSIRAIDGAVATGAMTPLQAVKARADIAETAATSRVRGVYEALDSPEKKEAFATGLLDEWTDGKGPLAKLDFGTVKALSSTLWNDARGAINRRTAENRVEAARYGQLIKDDIASMEATGKGLDPAQSGLSADNVNRLLGTEKLADWQAERAAAEQRWQATAGMETQSEADIAERLAMLEPKAGAPGFAEQDKIFTAASRRADAIAAARAKDPLGQAALAGVITLDPIDPTPEGIDASLANRKAQAEQVSTLFGSPVPLFRPEEIRAIKGSLGTQDPARHQAVMTQLDFMGQETSLKDVEDTFGDKAVDALQDWQARGRYSTPEETAAWLKERADPAWQARVKPLIAKGEAEARKVDFAQLVAAFDDAWLSSPGEPVDAGTRRAMMNDFERLTGERFAVTQDASEARAQAVERMKKIWGVSRVNGGRGGRLMAYPPEKSYPAIAGSHDWVRAELADVAAAHGIEAHNLALVADGKTKAAADRGEPPGYLLSAVDPKTGLDELVTDEDGRPLRHFFDAGAGTKAATARAKTDRRTRNDPWIVLGDGTTIGPLYAPWRPATAVDMAQRRTRIDEIIRERTSRMKAKTRTRATLANEGE